MPSGVRAAERWEVGARESPLVGARIRMGRGEDVVFRPLPFWETGGRKQASQ